MGVAYALEANAMHAAKERIENFIVRRRGDVVEADEPVHAQARFL